MSTTTAHIRHLGAAALPVPSKSHATCAWCRAEFASIVELLDHADAGHFSSHPTVPTWTPSAGEVRAIVAELRPVIAAFAERDARRLAAWSAEPVAA